MQSKMLYCFDKINFLARFSIVLFVNLGSLTAISVPKRVEKSCHDETSNESINRKIRLKAIKLTKKAVRLILMPAILRKKLNNTIDEKNRMFIAALMDKGGAITRKIL